MGNQRRNWLLSTLTLTLILLYTAALAGWLKPMPVEQTVVRLEPIIFVVVGYYLGRLPAQKHEKVLRDEISRQIQKADAAQHAKEQEQQNREAIEERLKNVRAALTSAAPNTSARALAEHLNSTGGTMSEVALRHSVKAALNILNL